MGNMTAGIPHMKENPFRLDDSKKGGLNDEKWRREECGLHFRLQLRLYCAFHGVLLHYVTLHRIAFPCIQGEKVGFTLYSPSCVVEGHKAWENDLQDYGLHSRKEEFWCGQWKWKWEMLVFWVKRSFWVQVRCWVYRRFCDEMGIDTWKIESEKLLKLKLAGICPKLFGCRAF